MNNTQVTLTVRLKAKAGLGSRLTEAARALLEPTRKESGCINYCFHTNDKDPDSGMFYENWINQEALDKHLSMPYLQEFQQVLETILAEKAEFTFWKIQE